MTKVKSINMQCLCFKNCQNIVNVNLRNIPFVGNTMDQAFYRCKNLQSVTNINNNVETMLYTFYGCSNLVTSPILPNNLRYLFYTYAYCNNLTDVSMIPDSVTLMDYAFLCCYNLVNIPTIPNSVTNIYRTFCDCNKIVNAPTIPNSAVNVSRCFESCKNLINVPTIPNSVEDMSYMFQFCNSLAVAPTIPNSVINASGIFCGCTNLVTPSPISENAIDASACYSNCSLLVNAQNIIPNTNNLTDISYLFGSCSNLVNYPEYYNSVNITSVFKMFDNCYNVTGNVYFKSENIIEVGHIFNNTSLTKNIYIPFTTTEAYTDVLYAWNVTDLYDDYNFTVYTRENIPAIDNGQDYIWYKLLNADGTFNGTWDLGFASSDGGDSAYYDIYDNCIRYEKSKDDHPCVGYPDFANNIVEHYNIGEASRTYRAFVNSGYDENGTTNGVYLRDLYPAPEHDVEIDETEYQYTKINDKIALTKYIGSNTTTKIPNM